MRKLILTHKPLNSEVATLLLRVIFGGLFIYHGLTKFLSYDEILPYFQSYLGLSPQASFNMVIFSELVCGILVFIGFLTRLAVIPIFVTMLVAYFVAHAKDPFNVKELAFTFMLISLVIFIAGGGRFSVDALIFRDRD